MSESLRSVDIIAAKRDGKILSNQQISAFVSGYSRGGIPDYQAAAFCMAVYLQGMTPEETGALTQAMIASGNVIDFTGADGCFVDKHSTGGVGDKISLILAPLMAACGLKIPMMSGRALGHTGGTLDKLDSIPGYSTALTQSEFIRCVNTIGFAMTGQSATIVPADRKLYALRDVTATVASIPLITGSILSKKFAEGANSLIMDVKCGSGAFMKTLDDARSLARSLTQTGKSLGRSVITVITDMSEPLGRKIGNFLEVEETVDCLRGEGPEDVMEVVLCLGGWMLIAAGLESDGLAAKERCKEALANGRAMQKFRENVEFQGGRLTELDSMLGSARATFSRNISVKSSGYLTRIDAMAAGMAGVVLGVGRDTAEDAVEPLAGIELLKKSGESVSADEPVLRLWSEEEWRLEKAEHILSEALCVGMEAPFSRGTRILEEPETGEIS